MQPFGNARKEPERSLVQVIVANRVISLADLLLVASKLQAVLLRREMPW